MNEEALFKIEDVVEMAVEIRYNRKVLDNDGSELCRFCWETQGSGENHDANCVVLLANAISTNYGTEFKRVAGRLGYIRS